MTGMRQRRATLIRSIATFYGVTVYPHPREVDVVVVAASDDALLARRVARDPSLDAVGRGYYGWLGGAMRAVVVPDWTCAPRRVARARWLARHRCARALVRLTSLAVRR